MASLTKSDMEVGVQASAKFLLFLSEGVLSREYVQFEVRTALDAEKQVLLLHEADARHGPFDFASEPQDLAAIMSYFFLFPCFFYDFLRFSVKCSICSFIFLFISLCFHNFSEMLIKKTDFIFIFYFISPLNRR